MSRIVESTSHFLIPLGVTTSSKGTPVQPQTVYQIIVGSYINLDLVANIADTIITIQEIG